MRLLKLLFKLFLIDCKQFFIPVDTGLSLTKYFESQNDKKLTEIVDFTIESNYSSSDLIPFIMKNSNSSFFVYGKRNFSSSLNFESHQVVFIDSFKLLNLYLKKVQSPQVQFTVISQKFSFLQLKDFFKILLQKNILNVNVLTFENNFEQVFTFVPFQSEKCLNTEPVLVNEFSDGKWKSSDFFPDKVKNLQNCTIRASAIHNPNTVIKTVLPDGSLKLNGTEVNLIRQIGKALNFHVKIDCTEVYHGLIFENGTATANIMRIKNGNDDLVLGSYYLSPIRAKFFSFSQFYKTDYTKIISPLGPLFTPLEILTAPFESLIWILFSIVCVFGAFSIPLIKKIRFGNFSQDASSIQMINLLVLIFGLSQVKLPKKNFNRILFACFAIFCLVLRTVYQAKLSYFMTGENRHKGPMKVNEMIDKKYIIYMSPSFSIHFKPSNHQESERLKEFFEHLNNKINKLFLQPTHSFIQKTRRPGYIMR